MVFRARELGWEEIRLGRIEDPLPDGPWDLVIAVLTVHHLDDGGKKDLFRRVREQSRSLVIGDVVTVESRAPGNDPVDPTLRHALPRGRPGRVVRRRGRLGSRRPGRDPRRLRLSRVLPGVAGAGDLELAGDVLAEVVDRLGQALVELAAANPGREIRGRGANLGGQLLAA